MDVAMLRRFHLVLAALCLLAKATCVIADNGRERPEQMIAPGTLAPIISSSPTIQGLGRLRQRGDGAVVASDMVSGTGTVEANHVVIEGVLAPGNSPGCIDFGGNVTFSASATFQVDIGGLIPCSEFDRITVAGQLTLNGPTLELILYGGYVPPYGSRFDILDWGSLNGSFAGIDIVAAGLPVPLIWDTADLYLTGEIAVDVQHFADGDLAPWDNPDTVINAADLMIAMQLVLGLRTPGALQYAHGDMDGDGDIDLADLMLVQQLVLQ